MLTPGADVLEAVVNVSEGRRREVIAHLAAAARTSLLDAHTDPHHHRSVLTLAGPPPQVEHDVRSLARATVAEVDLREHVGVHPRLGALDVVPFVALRVDAGGHLRPGDLEAAVEARDRFAEWAGDELGLPCLLYGPQPGGGDPVELPELRRRARTRPEETGNPTGAGTCCVGARPPLVAWNLWLHGADVHTARAMAAGVRRPGLRTLGLAVGDGVQVSCNLVDPDVLGPAEAHDLVAAVAPPGTVLAGAELVGLVPRSVLAAIPPSRWSELDVDDDRTIEARLERAGLDGGRF